ncbi:MAG: hypothetical protein R8F63_13020 [Acidimicrobiales bacterium]|nr:hypothetical protein [Acidimicrobiales bacterium]
MTITVTPLTASVRRLTVVLAVLAIVAASCGDDTNDDPSAEPTTTTTPPTTVADTPEDEPEPTTEPEPVDVEPTPWPGNDLAASVASGDAWIETPAATAFEGLTITATEPEGGSIDGAESDEVGAFAAFELGPDGAVFDEAVVVSVVVPRSLLGDDGAIPVVRAAVSHGDGPYEPVEVTVSRDGEQVVARAAVTGFSIVEFAYDNAKPILLSGDHAEPLSLFWASESRTFEISATSGGEDLVFGSFADAVLLGRDGAAWDWRPVPDGSLDLVGRCTALGNGTYAVGIHLGGGTMMVNSGPSGPWAPIECKRLIAPLDPPEGFSVVYATCGGRFEELTNLDPDALADAASGLDVTFEHRHFSEADCDSHNAGPAAELAALDADVYITHFGLESALRGDLGGEAGQDGKFYPEPLEDFSSLFIPIAPNAADWAMQRTLTPFETWLVFHAAVRDRLDPDVQQGGSIHWEVHPVIGPEPLDVGGFEPAFQEQWRLPLD